jgi:tRNA (mo5U34)-methyltransferase
MTEEQIEIVKQAEAFGPWYHEIELFPGYCTKSKMTESFPQWKQVRWVRERLNYAGKTVLDLGTMDGMWAFEAEALGGIVTAADIWQNEPLGRERFEFAQRVMGSKVALEPGVNAHELAHQLRTYDIIQCLGLLYHVQNPLLVLHHLAHCLKEGGKLLLETACLPYDHSPPTMRFNSDSGIYCDPTTFWAPNWNCLLAMLQLAGFSVEQESVMRMLSRIDRVCLVATRDGKLNPNFGLE